MAKAFTRRVAAMAWLVLAGLIAGCTTQSQRAEQDLAQLLEWYPGHYDNLHQVEADAHAGSAAHAALELDIVRVYAPLIGDFAYYQQETAAGDSRRVIAQRVVAFSVVKGKGVVQSIWSLAEPL